MLLRVYYKGELVQEKSLDGSIISVGRREECDVRLNYPEVSSSHLKIYIDNDTYYIVDQDSLNGTFLKGKRLRGGDKVRFTGEIPVYIAKNIVMEIADEELLNPAKENFTKIQLTYTHTENIDLDFSAIRDLPIKPKGMQQTHVKRSHSRSKDDQESSKNNNSSMMALVAIVILAGAYYLYHKSH